MEIWHDWQISPNNGWHGAERLDGDATLIVPVRNNVTGRLELFYIGVNGALYHNQQASPGGNWTGQTDIPTSSDGVRQMAVGQNVDGRLELLSIGHSAQLYHRSQMSPGGNWTDETALPASNAYYPAVGQNADGRLELFYLGTNSHLYHRWQMSPGGNWTSEFQFPDDSANAIAVGRNADGRLELFYLGTNKQLYHRWQMSPGGGPSQNDWTGEVPFSELAPAEDTAGAIAVGQNVGGRLELFYLGTNSHLYHRWQTSPGGNWMGEVPFPSPIAGANPASADAIAVGQNADGRLELFYSTVFRRFFHRGQTSPGGGPGQNDWTGETAFPTLSNQTRIAPYVAQNADGRLEIFYLQTSS